MGSRGADRLVCEVIIRSKGRDYTEGLKDTVKSIDRNTKSCDNMLLPLFRVFSGRSYVEMMCFLRSSQVQFQLRM